MTEYRLTYELNHRREKSESPGLGVAGTVEHRAGQITLGAGPATIIELPLGAYTSQRLQRVELIITAGIGATLPGSRLTTWRGLNGWYVETPGAPPVINFYANAVGDPSIVLLPVHSQRIDVLQITGAAAAAVNALTLPGVLEWSAFTSRRLNPEAGYTPESSSILVDWYLDTTIGEALPDLAPTAARYLKQYWSQGGGTLLLAEQGNNKITVPYCAGAFGFGPPIITLADIGNSFGQIPVSPLNWTAAMFKPHPRVFVRPSTSGWAAQHLYPGPIPTSQQVPLTEDLELSPHLASRRPTHSLWRILLEGVLMDVIIKHPDVGDFRRPRDIWRNVWAPAIAKSTAIETFGYYFFGFAPLLQRAFYSRGVLTNLDFLDFAYCLDLYDGGDTPLVEFPEV